MKNKNIQFSFNLQDYGWANACLQIGAKEVIFKKISYLCCPIDDLLHGLMAMIPAYATYQWISPKKTKQVKKSQFIWEDEPGGYSWQFTYINKNKMKIKICNIYTKRKKIELCETVETKRFVKIVMNEFDTLLKNNGFIVYKERWDSNSFRQFPICEFLLLKFYLIEGRGWLSKRNSKDFKRTLKDDITLINKAL